ncbi:MAG: hypothetical protein IT355_15730 [Gemmatimonadaceae bacterium]|nr:hypothetical protein [Gemmatimonadaceae bacterium]
MRLSATITRGVREPAARKILTATVAVTVLSACSGGSKKSVTRVVEPPVEAVALTVAGSGTGSGRIQSVPGGIDCQFSGGAGSGACTALYAPGTVVTLQPEPGTTSVFLTFGGDCTLTSCQTVMKAARVVTATFVPNVLSVMAHASSTGSGRVTSTPAGIDCMLTDNTPGAGSCSSSFPVGTAVTLTQEPSAGATFQAWSSGCSGDPCTVTLSGQRTVDVIYRRPTAPSQALLTLTASPASRGSGTIVSSPTGVNCTVTDAAMSGVCSVAFPSGTIVTLTQVPGSQSVFQGWGGDCTGNPCQVAMTQPRTGEVTYRVPPPGIVSVIGMGTGSGIVSSAPSGISCTITAGVPAGICSASFPAGSDVTLTGAGTGDASFDGFTGACTGASCLLPVASAVTSTVRAAFSAAPLRLTVAPGGGSAGGGVITSIPAGISCVLSGTSSTGACTALFAPNTVVTLQQASNGNAVFTSWGGDCVGNPCQLVMSQARTAYAVFQTQGVTITGGGTGTGLVTSVPAGIACTITAGVVGGTCATTFPAHTVVTLTATTSGLSSFSGYSGACVATTCTLTMVTGTTASVTAQFQAPPTLTLAPATGSAGGGVLTSTPSGLACTLSGLASSGTCSMAYAVNSSVTVTQVPSAGSVFLNWAGACSGSGTCVVSLTHARAVQALYREAVPGSVTIMAGTGTGNGSVSSSPGGIACAINGAVKGGICRAIFPVGSTVTLIPVANAGSRFTGFSGSCSGMTCVMTVPENGDLTVTANFAP